MHRNCKIARVDVILPSRARRPSSSVEILYGIYSSSLKLGLRQRKKLSLKCLLLCSGCGGLSRVQCIATPCGFGSQVTIPRGSRNDDDSRDQDVVGAHEPLE